MSAYVHKCICLCGSDFETAHFGILIYHTIIHQILRYIASFHVQWCLSVTVLSKTCIFGWLTPDIPSKVSISAHPSTNRLSLAPSSFQKVAMMGGLVLGKIYRSLRKVGDIGDGHWTLKWANMLIKRHWPTATNLYTPQKCWCLSSQILIIITSED